MSAYPHSSHPGGQRGHRVPAARARAGALRTHGLLIGPAEPVQLAVVLHTELGLRGEDPGLGVGGGSDGHRGGAPRLLRPQTPGQHGENGLLKVHPVAVRSRLRWGRAC